MDHVELRDMLKSTGGRFQARVDGEAIPRERIAKSALMRVFPSVVKPTASVQPVAPRDDPLPSPKRRKKRSSVLLVPIVPAWGMLSTIVYVFFATVLALSAWGLDRLANKPINLGVVENAWFRDIFEVPVYTFLRGDTTAQLVQRDLALNLTRGTQSLSDLQYDECGKRDPDCAERLRANTERVLLLLASGFKLVSGFEAPEFVTAFDQIRIQYVNTLSGFNTPVVQYSLPGHTDAVVCILRRNRFRVAQEEEELEEIDSVAICSKRPFDPDWICENEVEMSRATYVFRVNLGKAVYLGETRRREVYYNPGNVARLSGGPRGTALLSAVIAIDEYNGGILQASAPYDVAPAYLCKGTFDFSTNTGMRWQGQGVVSMTWKANSLMVTNSLVLWALTMLLAVLQLAYLPRSSVCVVPVYMAKSIVGPIILGFACYGNFNVQVLTTYLEQNRVTSFNAEPYRLCGPALIAAILAIMSGTAIQMVFASYLVSPSYLLTLVGVANFLLVSVLEAFVFPKKSTMRPRPCALPSSTTCADFAEIRETSFLSPILALSTVAVGILLVRLVARRRDAVDRMASAKNSLLRMFDAESVLELAITSAGGSVITRSDGALLLDAGIMLHKNLVRVSTTAIVRTNIVKYALLYRCLPPPLARLLSRLVGRVLVVRATGDKVSNKITFMELKDMQLNTWREVPTYYS
ncbi:hypothetical protein ATCC90586_007994 [Pythium insidiosum]|nr:hypothetical protein ATCC90586_007994 [Pythium insidiosum]